MSAQAWERRRGPRRVKRAMATGKPVRVGGGRWLAVHGTSGIYADRRAVAEAWLALERRLEKYDPHVRDMIRRGKRFNGQA